MNIGILGIGVIGSAIVNGFCLNDDQSHKLFISPRSRSLSEALQKKYTAVTRCDSNQEVVDRSDIIIVAILPQIGLDVIRQLEFREEQHVVNLMSDKKLHQIAEAIGPSKTLVHMVPLSFVANREGPIAIYPRNDFIADVFNELGHIIQVDDVEKIESIAAITGLMTSYYKLLNEISKWGTDHDLTSDESIDYTSHFFEALSKHSRKGHLDTLASEMTPGGINELALKHLESEAAFKPWLQTLDPMVKRIRNK